MAEHNLIIIKTDQQRWDSLGCMGNPVVRTPHLDALAGQGLCCTEAFTVTPLCVPSRVGFFRGQYPHRTGSLGNGPEDHIQVETETLLDPLLERGYRFGLVGKNHCFSDGWLERHAVCREEYSHWEKSHGEIRESDRRVGAWRRQDPRPRYAGGAIMEGLVEEPEPFPPEQCMTARIAEDGCRFLEANAEAPFCLYFSFPDPHFPNVVCEPWYSRYDADDLPPLEGLEIDWESHPFKHFVQAQASGFDTMTERQRRQLLAIYYAQVSFIDEAVGQLLGRLAELGLAERTAVVFTSDHGDFGGRYGLVGKTGGFHEVLMRVPLLMRLPGIAGGRTIDARVATIDVMPTLLEYLGVAVPARAQGRSFLPVLRGEQAEHRQVLYGEVGAPEPPPPILDRQAYEAYARRRFAEDGIFWFIEYTCRGRMAMIRDGRWKYCHYVGDRPELYDLESDPLELHNLAAEPAHAERREALRGRLLEWFMTAPVADGPPPELPV